MECNKRIDTATGLKCTAWHLVKLHLQNSTEKIPFSPSFLTNDRPIEEKAMYPYLEAARARLSNEYAAVGLLEQFETSLLLFDAALGMPNFDWRRRFRGKRNSAREEQLTDKKNVLRQAWPSVAVSRYIALDIMLYDYAVAVHAKQVAEHDL